MTRPYKVSLVIAVLLCVGMIVYYMNVSGAGWGAGEAGQGGQASEVMGSAGQASVGEGRSSQEEEYTPEIKRLLSALGGGAEPQAVESTVARGNQVELVTAVEVEPPTLTLGSTDVEATFPRRAESGALSLRVTEPQAVGQTGLGANDRGRSGHRSRGTSAVERRYTIKPGDTFSSIAVTVYGSERYWVDIAQANPSVNPSRLDVGQEIRLPLQGSLHRSGHTRSVQRRTVTYTVRPGDSLYTIAGEHYNSPNFWRVIYEANLDTIGKNPADLEAGMSLMLPPTGGGSR